MKLGDKVIVNALVVKSQKLINPERWHRETQFTVESCKPFEAMYIGWRTAQTGITTYDSEDGPQFRSKDKFKYLLVVTNERKNPIMVDPNTTLVN